MPPSAQSRATGAAPAQSASKKRSSPATDNVNGRSKVHSQQDERPQGVSVRQTPSKTREKKQGKDETLDFAEPADNSGDFVEPQQDSAAHDHSKARTATDREPGFTEPAQQAAGQTSARKPSRKSAQKQGSSQHSLGSRDQAKQGGAEGADQPSNELKAVQNQDADPDESQP